MVIKIVNDELTDILGSENSEINLNAKTPVLILMVGLQGSGKTTSTGKLAKWIINNKNKKVLMASLDIYRPAAQEQLISLGKANNIETLEAQTKKQPLEIASIAVDKAKNEGFDVLILDSAGRNQVDKEMMNEIKNISKKFKFNETLLVSDAMTGQDAVNTAKAFSEAVDLSGIILTRIDGDSRGGAALSMKYITSKPIKFLVQVKKLMILRVFILIDCK